MRVHIARWWRRHVLEVVWIALILAWWRIGPGAAEPDSSRVIVALLLVGGTVSEFFKLALIEPENLSRPARIRSAFTGALYVLLGSGSLLPPGPTANALLILTVVALLASLGAGHLAKWTAPRTEAV